MLYEVSMTDEQLTATSKNKAHRSPVLLRAHPPSLQDLLWGQKEKQCRMNCYSHLPQYNSPLVITRDQHGGG